MPCVIVVLPFSLAQRDSWQSLFVSRARKCASFFHVFGQFCTDKRVTLNKKQKERNIQQRSIHRRNDPNHVEFVDQHHPTGLKNMYMMTRAAEASQMAIVSKSPRAGLFRKFRHGQ